MDSYIKKFKNILEKTSIKTQEARIRLNEKNSNLFFRDFILKGNSEYALEHYDKRVSSIKKIIKCKKIIKNNIEEIRSENKLNRLSENLENGIEIVYIFIENEMLSFDIFESINSKKLELSLADLMKNLLFKKCKDVSEGKYVKAEEKWCEIIDLFDPCKEDISNFLKTYWSSKNAIVRGKKFYKEFKRSGFFKKTKDPLELIQDMLDYAKIYKNIIEPDGKYWGNGRNAKKIIRSLKDLNYLNIKTCRPLLLQIAKTIKDDKKISEMFQKIEILSFVSLTLFKDRPPKYEIFYSKKAFELYKSKHKIKKLNEIDREMNKKIIIYFKKFEHFVYDKQFTNNKEVTYILYKILKEKMGTNLLTSWLGIEDIRDSSVEHVMPQKGLSKWKDLIKNILKEDEMQSKYKNLSFKEKLELYKTDYCYLLGNMALLTKIDNNETSDKTFEEKKEIYKKTEKNNHLFKNYILNKDMWTYKEIQENTEILTKELKEILFRIFNN